MERYLTLSACFHIVRKNNSAFTAEFLITGSKSALLVICKEQIGMLDTM
jgi:hypothetical protein